MSSCECTCRACAGRGSGESGSDTLEEIAEVPQFEVGIHRRVGRDGEDSVPRENVDFGAEIVVHGLRRIRDHGSAVFFPDS